MKRFKSNYKPVLQYEKPECGEALEDPFVRADLSLTKRVAQVVQQHYPLHPWKVEVSHQSGVIKIQIPQFMGVRNWYVVYINTLKSDPGMKSIVRACGEILERYKLPRAGFSHDHFMSAMRSRPILGKTLYGHVPE